MPEPSEVRHTNYHFSPDGTREAGEWFEITVDEVHNEDDASPRLDQYVSSLPSFPPRSQLKQRITSLTVNGSAAKLSAKVRPGDRISFRLIPEIAPSVAPESIDLDVIFEDEAVLVINKTAGMVVHPGAGNWTGTVLHALMGRYPHDSYFSDATSDGVPVAGSDSPDSPRDSPVRPGIVHRLDKDTSGVLIVAKNSESHRFLTAQFAARTTAKRYIALVKGSPLHTTGYIAGSLERDPRHRTRFRVSGELRHDTLPTLESDVPGWTESPSGSGTGKPALTTYTVLRRFAGYSLVMLRPHTGRTHQLRVHMTAIGSPIVGDPVYARADGHFREPPLMLHALRLAIATHPDGALRRFTAPVPEAFRQVVQEVRLRFPGTPHARRVKSPSR